MTITEITFDSVGNITQQRTRAGEIFVFSYDVLDRLKMENEPFSTTDIVYDYDLAGRMTAVTDANGAITHSYDSAGRLVLVSGRILKQWHTNMIWPVTVPA